MMNKEPLLFEIETIIQNLEEYRQALQEDDETMMCQLLQRRAHFKRKKHPAEQPCKAFCQRLAFWRANRGIFLFVSAFFLPFFMGFVVQ